jgi:hypothetical protein
LLGKAGGSRLEIAGGRIGLNLDEKNGQLELRIDGAPRGLAIVVLARGSRRFPRQPRRRHAPRGPDRARRRLVEPHRLQLHGWRRHRRTDLSAISSWGRSRSTAWTSP